MEVVCVSFDVSIPVLLKWRKKGRRVLLAGEPCLESLYKLVTSAGHAVAPENTTVATNFLGSRKTATERAHKVRQAWSLFTEPSNCHLPQRTHSKCKHNTPLRRMEETADNAPHILSLRNNGDKWLGSHSGILSLQSVWTLSNKTHPPVDRTELWAHSMIPVTLVS